MMLHGYIENEKHTVAHLGCDSDASLEVAVSPLASGLRLHPYSTKLSHSGCAH